MLSWCCQYPCSESETEWICKACGAKKQKAAEFRVVEAEQLQLGWIELRGMTQTRHSFIVLRRLDDRRYIVKNPGWIVEHRPT